MDNPRESRNRKVGAMGRYMNRSTRGKIMGREGSSLGIKCEPQLANRDFWEFDPVSLLKASTA